MIFLLIYRVCRLDSDLEPKLPWGKRHLFMIAKEAPDLPLFNSQYS